MSFWCALTSNLCTLCMFVCACMCVCVCLNLHREVKCKHTDAITLLAWYTKKFLHRYRFWNMYSRAAKCSSQEQGKKKTGDANYNTGEVDKTGWGLGGLKR